MSSTKGFPAMKTPDPIVFIARDGTEYRASEVHDLAAARYGVLDGAINPGDAEDFALLSGRHCLYQIGEAGLTDLFNAGTTPEPLPYSLW